MKESLLWHSIYGSQSLKDRRDKTYLKKYRSLGLSGSDSQLHILDVCCGTGEFTDVIAKYNPNSLIVGIDIFAPSDIKINHDNLYFIRANSYQLCLPDNCFDQLFCVHSLHHLGEVAQWNDLIAEFRRVLKPGGRLYVIDHYPSIPLHLAFGLIKSPLGKLIPWMREFQKQLIEEKHILKYWLSNWKSLLDIFEKNGLRRIRYSKGLFFFYGNYEKTSSPI